MKLKNQVNLLQECLVLLLGERASYRACESVSKTYVPAFFQDTFLIDCSQLAKFRGFFERMMQASSSVAAELKQQQQVSSDDDFSSEDEQEGKSQADELQASVFVGYPTTNALASGHREEQIFEVGRSRISSLLVAAKSGATACLICLEKVRKVDPIWHCKQGCYAILHLVCIQSWSRQSLNSSAHWHCPKCRADYPQSEIPREYHCFCGKQLDPESDPWLVPHSCGERCERALGSCGHTCKLLCHPGPCPPCPQLVNLECHCGNARELRRCGQKSFSCNQLCNLPLSCGIHKCEEKCHEGSCQPCNKAGLHHCKCGSVAEVRPCSEADFQCQTVCENKLSCKKHVCGKRCHPGPCGDCELQGRRTCPCGKQEYPLLACDVKALTCGSTCGKLLSCGRHRCPDRCHSGECAATCRVTLKKACRCGASRKEVPCFQDLACERRCQGIRNCARHSCRRRCCDGDCPPCSEVCGKKLRCGNHKCPAPCHRGLCAPCPVTVQIPCGCGYRSLEVPCGAEKGIRPPKCSRRCSVVPCCGHGAQCKPHRCHYGPCPPCKLTCNSEQSCGHRCEITCHGPRPPAKLEYGVKKRSKKKDVPLLPIAGTPCPPCPVLVYKECMGRHAEGVKQVVCSDNSLFSCGRPCGSPLPCGNHFCEKTCHSPCILPSEEIGKGQTTDDSCSTCSLHCQKKRSSSCRHPCELSCHPGPCPPCKIHLKRTCHCGTLARFFECSDFNSLTTDEQSKLLSCGGPCHRKLEKCSHFCSEICHPGPCPQVCAKKVTVRCSCQRLKKEWPCCEVRSKTPAGPLLATRSASFVGFLPCDDECSKLKAVEAEQDIQKRKPSNVEVPVVKQQPKYRKPRAGRRDAGEISKAKEFCTIASKWIAVAALCVILVACVYFGVKGLLNLSEWMNERDAQRRMSHDRSHRPWRS